MAQLKLFDAFPRKAGTTLEQFSEHWTARHAAIAKRLPQIRHYVQSHRLEDKPEALGAPLGPTWCDGASETWYDSPEALAEMMDEPALPELVEDEANFMDLEVIRHPVLTREHLVDAGRFDLARHGVKALIFVHRAPGTTREELHARLAATGPEPGRAVGATRQVVCVAVEESYTFLHPNPDVRDDEDQSYDGVIELWWPDVVALAAGAEADPDAWSRLVAPAAVDAGRSFALFAREHPIIP